jgi:hypothetical protein
MLPPDLPCRRPRATIRSTSSGIGDRRPAELRWRRHRGVVSPRSRSTPSTFACGSEGSSTSPSTKPRSAIPRLTALGDLLGVCDREVQIDARMGARRSRLAAFAKRRTPQFKAWLQRPQLAAGDRGSNEHDFRFGTKRTSPSCCGMSGLEPARKSGHVFECDRS